MKMFEVEPYTDDSEDKGYNIIYKGLLKPQTRII